MASKVIQRIRHLISLASSPEEQEARTAAVQACNLIRQHGVKLVGERVTEAPKRARRAKRAAPRTNPYDRRRRSDVYIGPNYSPVICCGCDGLIGVGENMAYYPNKGYFHIWCSSKAVS